VGPPGVGKTTLALDVAAFLLCTAEGIGARPCRACRACRMLAGGNHPDLHRLVPEGPGGQIRIGARADAEPGTVRRLVADLALLPVEGGARVAIVEQADRMNEEAQSALLKTLEEPPTGVTLLLTAAEEERLLPTIRSRCARVRLGPLGVREIEALMSELSAADPPTAARLARLAAGRPGVALAHAAAPEAVIARGEIARSLIDLLGATRATRLTTVRALLGRAAEAVGALERGRDGSGRVAGAGGRKARGQAVEAAPVAPADPAPAEPSASADPAAPADADAASTGARRAPAAERRRAAVLLIDIWRDVSRDLALAQLGEAGRGRDPSLLEDLAASARLLDSRASGRFLGRLDRAGELIESNVAPELVIDALAIAWPHRSPAA
jgi:hypothetical protein